MALKLQQLVVSFLQKMKVEQRLVQGQRGFDVGAVGDAESQHVLQGKTFSSEFGTDIEGAIPVRSGHVNAQSVSRSGTSLRLRPQVGYYGGESGNSIQINHPTISPSNIKAGVNFADSGLIGTLIEGKRFDSGNIAVDQNISNPTETWFTYTLPIDFTASYIYARVNPNITSSGGPSQHASYTLAGCVRVNGVAQTHFIPRLFSYTGIENRLNIDSTATNNFRIYGTGGTANVFTRVTSVDWFAIS